METVLKNQAIDSFRAGLNCAQAVLAVYSEKFQFDKEMALSLSCGFGGGMGRLQETCGTVTGAFMALSIYNYKLYQDNKERKEKTYEMIRLYDSKFKALHKSTNCGSLLNCDLKTPEGQKYFKDNKLSETVCEKCMADSIKIIEELIAE